MNSQKIDKFLANASENYIKTKLLDIILKKNVLRILVGINLSDTT